MTTLCPAFVDERVNVIPGVYSMLRRGERSFSLVSMVSRPGIIPAKEGPLEGEMEHEAREARPIGAQGAFASNSMHYTYTPALSIPG